MEPETRSDCLCVSRAAAMETARRAGETPFQKVYSCPSLDPYSFASRQLRIVMLARLSLLFHTFIRVDGDETSTALTCLLLSSQVQCPQPVRFLMQAELHLNPSGYIHAALMHKVWRERNVGFVQICDGTLAELGSRCSTLQ